METNLKHLQHVSDIRGIAVQNSANERVDLNIEFTGKLTSSFLFWLAEKKNKPVGKLKISVGMDTRLSGPALKSAALEMISNYGAHALDCQMATSAALHLSITNDKYKCDGAIMFTASHLPFNWNGMKFIDEQGVLNKEDIKIVIQDETEKTPAAKKKGKIEETDILSDYAKSMVDFIVEKTNGDGKNKLPLKGFKVIVDAANGVGGFFAKKILDPLGADTSGSIFLEPDGNFPNHLPNTENNAAIEALCKAVVDNDGDLGIIFDCDLEKAAFVDYRGFPITRDRLIALISAIVIEENPKATIVTDSITSDILTSYIQDKLGGVHHRFKRGYKRVINEAMRLNNERFNCPLAIETSGHSAFSENNFIDDGAFMAAKVLIRLAKFKQQGIRNVCELIKDFTLPGESHQFRLRIKSAKPEEEANRVIHTFKRFSGTVPGWKIIINNYDGIRVAADKYFGDGWCLLRMSLHEPYLVLNVESTTKRGIKMFLDRVMKIFSKINQVDSTPITKFLGEM